MKNRIFIALLTVAFLACKSESTKENTETSGKVKLKLESASFVPDSAIPIKYTCDSPNQVFPELHWNNTGNDYKSFVLFVDDPDAVPVVGYVWEHWLIYDIPGSTAKIGEGSDKAGPLPAGTKRGLTSFGDTLYGGPCPPPAQLHHYRFKLYGLDIASCGLPVKAGSKQVLEAIKGHILDSALLTGTFKH